MTAPVTNFCVLELTRIRSMLCSRNNIHTIIESLVLRCQKLAGALCNLDSDLMDALTCDMNEQ